MVKMKTLSSEETAKEVVERTEQVEQMLTACINGAIEGFDTKGLTDGQSLTAVIGGLSMASVKLIARAVNDMTDQQVLARMYSVMADNLQQLMNNKYAYKRTKYCVECDQDHDDATEQKERGHKYH